MQRRRFVMAARCGPGLAAAWALGTGWPQAVHAGPEDGLNAQSVTFGSSLALTGPLGAAGVEHTEGIRAAFAAINRVGGLYGRELRLETLDDAYEPARTADNLRQLLARGSCMALLSCLGTANNAAILPLVEQANIPYVGPITGASSLRLPGQRNVFHVRASYTDETVRVVQQLVSFGLKDIAVVYLDNAFGKEVLKEAEAALAGHNMALLSGFALAVDGSNAQAVASAVHASKAGAVILGTAGAASTAVVLALRKQAPGLPLAGLSVSVFTAELAKLGPAAAGLALTQVFPDPERPRTGVVRAYQAAMRAAGDGPIGSSSFEGWVNAQVAIEAMRRVGRDLSRDKFRASLSQLRRLDLGDFVLGYTGTAPHVASRYVELAVLGTHGKRLG